MGDALLLASRGWQHGAAYAARLRDKINAQHPARKKLKAYSVAGAMPDVRRYLAGNPQHMRTLRLEENRNRPVITLLSDIGTTWTTSPSELLNRAAAVAAVVDAIESAGFSAHVIALQTSTHDTTMAFSSFVTVKAAGEHVDLARLVFGIGHPAMLRRLNFALRGSDPFCRPLTSALGVTMKLEPRQDWSDRQIYLLPGVKTIEAFQTEQSTLRVGVDALVASLKRQGCPAFTDWR